MPFDRCKTNRQEEAIGASKSAGSNNSEGALGGYRPGIDCVGMKYSGIVRKTIRIRPDGHFKFPHLWSRKLLHL
jgi:hypothetical protein